MSVINWDQEGRDIYWRLDRSVLYNLIAETRKIVVTKLFLLRYSECHRMCLDTVSNAERPIVESQHVNILGD
jgi:hypothetical protein